MQPSRLDARYGSRAIEFRFWSHTPSRVHDAADGARARGGAALVAERCLGYRCRSTPSCRDWCDATGCVKFFRRAGKWLTPGAWRTRLINDRERSPDRLAEWEALADEIKAWSPGFGRRAESQDVVAVRLTLHGVRDTEQGRAMYEKAIASGFAGYRYAARVDALPSGELKARLVVAIAGGERERFRVREERVGDETAGFAEPVAGKRAAPAKASKPSVKRASIPKPAKRPAAPARTGRGTSRKPERA